MAEVADPIEAQILDIIAKELKRDRDSLRLDATFAELEIDSLDVIEVVFRIEETFDIYVPTADESFKLENLRDVVEGVKRLIAEKDAGAS
ncbi:acyl carrier protein [Zavarzinia sp. CC-PAN008]|uniref:acyl carrier protein n=1 Tax=Zavarzinia sp. CC-PAN008 TaxID=3243332 RepID=UPI003F74A93A